MNLSKLYDKAVSLIPPPPTRFTLNEWYLNDRVRRRTCLDQQKLADCILSESERQRTYIAEVSSKNKREVDHTLEQKLNDIKFNQNELVKQRKAASTEIDNLITYNERINDALSSVRQDALKICKKCIMFREGRIGIDLCHDDVERELLKESEIIAGVEMLLCRALEQGNEQVRRLRSTVYLMDRDLEDKQKAYEIDYDNLGLKETSLNLSMYHGFTPLDNANITTEEWDEFSQQSILNSAKEIASAVNLRSYIDMLLKQVIEDLRNQYNTVNDSFRRRIEETKESKTKLEVQHSEVTRQANEMSRNILALQTTLAESEAYMALAHTRLGNRSQRPSMELCRDITETNLVNEVRELRENCAVVQQQLAEAQASLRYLLKTQIQIEEDINIKTNTLKIDEVDCMTLRQSIDFHSY